jgi:thiamine biosynthesis protein ThiI
MVDTIILRTNEICLKGRNRHLFERFLLNDVKARLAPIGDFKVRGDQGSVFVLHDGPMADAVAAACSEAVRTVFGVATILFAARVAKDIEAIGAAAEVLIAKRGKTTFKVFASRSDKTFPMQSMEIARTVGGRLLDNVSGLIVDVHDPKTNVTIEVAKEFAYVAVGREEGAGGLPGGVAGKVVAMLSGGIDSPVAAWKLMRRGCVPVLVHFHSYPYVGAESIDKVKRLAAKLDAFFPGLILHLVPIGDAQREITVKSDETLRVLLYRRLMFRIAEKIARREHAYAVITGDSVGQVASQTIENIAAVSAITTMPIYRPLIGDDKEDIVCVAKRIGTYATSIEPHDDCCTLFVPRRPATRAKAADLDIEEAKYDVNALVDAALAATETVAVTSAPVRATVAA